MAVSTQDIVKLRERTGAGIMDCKNALIKADNDIDKACDILRELGVAKAAKKANRIAAEGVVHAYIHMGGKIGVLIEVNCETDFVARSDAFMALVKDLAMQVAASAPEYVAREEIPAARIEKEREILRNEALNEGKPEKIVRRRRTVVTICVERVHALTVRIGRRSRAVSRYQIISVIVPVYFLRAFQGSADGLYTTRAYIHFCHS